MATSIWGGWRRVKRMPRFQWAKLIGKRVLGRDPWLRPRRNRALRVIDGDWAICPSLLGSKPVVYSMGVGRCIEFDRVLIRDYRAEIFAFDPTPTAIDWLDTQSVPGRFNFYPWAIAGTDRKISMYPRPHGNGRLSDMYSFVAQGAHRDSGIDVSARCISSIMAQLGHDTVDMIKMDIEGAEYEVLDHLVESNIRPLQLLIEFHHRFAGFGAKKTVNILNRLRSVGYSLNHVSSTGREMTLTFGGASRQSLF